MQSVNVYARKGVIWIVTMSLTEDSLWMAEGPALALLSESKANEKGDAILYALSKSRKMQRTVSWDAPSVLLRASGARSWRVFEKDATLLWVERDGQIALIPTQRQKSDGGYLPLPDEKAVLLRASATPEEVGRAVEQALELCE